MGLTRVYRYAAVDVSMIPSSSKFHSITVFVRSLVNHSPWCSSSSDCASLIDSSRSLHLYFLSKKKQAFIVYAVTLILSQLLWHKTPSSCRHPFAQLNTEVIVCIVSAAIHTERLHAKQIPRTSCEINVGAQTCPI